MKYFKVKELVPKDVYKERGEKSIELMDSRILEALDNLRILVGLPFIVNSLQYRRDASGLRMPFSKHYSKFSQHSFGRAVDFIVPDYRDLFPEDKGYETIYSIIKNNREALRDLHFVEVVEGWVHIDCRSNANGEDLLFWSPKEGYIDI